MTRNGTDTEEAKNGRVGRNLKPDRQDAELDEDRKTLGQRP